MVHNAKLFHWLVEDCDIAHRAEINELFACQIGHCAGTKNFEMVHNAKLFHWFLEECDNALRAEKMSYLYWLDHEIYACFYSGAALAQAPCDVYQRSTLHVFT